MVGCLSRIYMPRRGNANVFGPAPEWAGGIHTPRKRKINSVVCGERQREDYMMEKNNILLLSKPLLSSSGSLLLFSSFLSAETDER